MKRMKKINKNQEEIIQDNLEYDTSLKHSICNIIGSPNYIKIQ